MKTMLHIVEPESLITEAGSYDEALRKLQHDKIDVVLLDIDLRSEKSGLDLLAHIRAKELPIKVIMLSASDDRDTVMHCIASGASGYIAKSSGNESVFADALSTVLNDGIFLPESILTMPRQGIGTKSHRPPKVLSDFALPPRPLPTTPRTCRTRVTVAPTRQPPAQALSHVKAAPSLKVPRPPS